MRIVPFIGGEGKGSIPPTLEELDLSDNSFDDMPRNTFKPFSNLKKLNLSRNGLSDFEAVTFVGLKKLEVLDLSNNRFTEVPNKALRVRYFLIKYVDYFSFSWTHCSWEISNAISY